MDVNVIINDAQRPIFERYFKPTLPAASPSAKLNVFEAPVADGNFMGKGYLDVVRRRLELVMESISGDTGEPVIWSDVDMLFFDVGEDVCEAAVRELGDSPYIFQHETPKIPRGINSGFFVVRKCAEARELFGDVLARVMKPYNNKFCQYHFNTIAEAGANIPLLSSRFLANTFRVDQRWSKLPPDTLLFHGNFTFTPQEKVALLDRFLISR